jgi:MFS family permease
MSLLQRITPEDAYRRRWQLLALTSVGSFIVPFDGSVVSVALPSIGADLQLSFSASIWVQAAYLLTTAVLLIPVGRLADQHGRVRFYLLGIAVFTLSSLFCAVSMNGAWLIGGRIVHRCSSPPRPRSSRRSSRPASAAAPSA